MHDVPGFKMAIIIEARSSRVKKSCLAHCAYFACMIEAIAGVPLASAALQMHKNPMILP
jgi:hypothetical protein